MTRRVVKRKKKRPAFNREQYGDCEFHTFFAMGEDGVRCCAEPSCKFDIDRHRKPPKKITESRKVKGRKSGAQVPRRRRPAPKQGRSKK